MDILKRLDGFSKAAKHDLEKVPASMNDVRFMLAGFVELSTDAHREIERLRCVVGETKRRLKQVCESLTEDGDD